MLRTLLLVLMVVVSAAHAAVNECGDDGKQPCGECATAQGGIARCGCPGPGSGGECDFNELRQRHICSSGNLFRQACQIGHQCVGRENDSGCLVAGVLPATHTPTPGRTRTATARPTFTVTSVSAAPGGGGGGGGCAVDPTGDGWGAWVVLGVALGVVLTNRAVASMG